MPGRARQALLHLRKHVDGARVVAIERIAGERTVVLEAGDAPLVLRLSGSAPALSLVLDGAVLGRLGEGPEAWPPPAGSPEREWDRLDPAVFEAAVAAAQAEGRSLVRAVLAACPGLGPLLARETDGSAASLVALRERLREAAPTLLVPGPPDAWHDADLAEPGAVALAPVAPAGGGRHVLRPPSWLEAGAVVPGGPPPRPRLRAPPARRPRRRAPADPAPRAAGGEPRPGPRGARRRERPAAPGRGPPGLRARDRGGPRVDRGRGPLRARAAPHRRPRPAPRRPRQRRADVRQGPADRAGAPPGRAAAARDALGARRGAGARGARARRPRPGRAARARGGRERVGPRGGRRRPSPLPDRRAGCRCSSAATRARTTT